MEKTPPITYLLCRWLDPNAIKAETDRHFSEFREHAYGVLKNRLDYLVFKYRLTGDSYGQGSKSLSGGEKLMHELMVRLCVLAKDERPKAIETVLELQARLLPLDRNPPCPQRLVVWKHDIKKWTVYANDFFLNQHNHAAPEKCERRAKKLNAQFRKLQTDGYALLDWLNNLETISKNLDEAAPAFISEEEGIADEKYQNLRQLIKHIEQLVTRSGSNEADMRLEVPRGAKFVIDAGKLIDTLPKIQIPGIGLLFHWAEWVAIDLKRANKSLADALPGSESPIEDTDGIPLLPQQLQQSDTMALEHWLGLQRIDSLLSAPIQIANQAYQSAATLKAQKQAQNRFARARSIYLESMNVFLLAVEGRTREEISTCLGMTEDEVRGRKAYIAEMLAPDFIDAYRTYQGEKLMRILIKLSDKKVQNLAELACAQPLFEWPGEVIEFLLRLPQTQASSRLRKAENDKRRAEDRLVEKFMKTADPLNRSEERQALISCFMSADHWDKPLMIRLGLKRDELHKIKKRISKADRVIHDITTELGALEQDFNRRVALYPAILGLILNYHAADEAAIANQLGLKNAEQLQQYRKRIQAILEHISIYRGD